MTRGATGSGVRTDPDPGAGTGGGAAEASVGELARAGVVLSSMYLAARVLGYVRVVVLGAEFGAGPELDAFYAAFRIPDLIYQLSTAGALASALVPAFAALHASGEDARMWRILSRVGTIVLLALAGLSAVAFVFAEPLCALVAPGFDAEGLRRTTELTRVMLLSPIFLSLGSVATAALNSRRAFGAAAVAPVVYNVAIIVGAVVLGPIVGVVGLAWGVVAGSAAHFLVQLPSLARMGFRVRQPVRGSDPLVRDTLMLVIPRLLGLGAMQIMFAVMVGIASGLGPGAVTAWSVAYSLLQLPMGIVGIPLGVVIFPSLSAAKAADRTETYVGLVDRALRLVLFVMLPMAAFAMVLRTPVVSLLLGHGRFSAADVSVTAATLLPLLAALPAQAGVAVMARAFYARRDTRTPVAAAVAGVGTDIAVALLAAPVLGLAGLGLGIALGAWVEAVALYVALTRVEPSLSRMLTIRSAPRILLAAGVGGYIAGAVGAAVEAGLSGPGDGLVPAAAGIVVGTLTGLGGYLLAALVLRLKEPAVFLASLRRGPAA
jgi:putative peptidoglycan lipid II flippase